VCVVISSRLWAEKAMGEMARESQELRLQRSGAVCPAPACTLHARALTCAPLPHPPVLASRTAAKHRHAAPHPASFHDDNLAEALAYGLRDGAGRKYSATALASALAPPLQALLRTRAISSADGSASSAE
jgi:hypothetical protein